jgi:hypothetical protein
LSTGIALFAVIVSIASAILAWRKSHYEMRPVIDAEAIRCSPRTRSHEREGFWQEPCIRFINRGPIDYKSVTVEILTTREDWKPILAFRVSSQTWEHRLDLGEVPVGSRRIVEANPGPAGHGGNVSIRVECRGKRWRWWWTETWLTAVEVEVPPIPPVPRVSLI